MTVKDHYENFAGTVCWVIDTGGIGEVRYDYLYTGTISIPARSAFKSAFPPHVTRSSGGAGPNGAFPGRLHLPDRRQSQGEARHKMAGPAPEREAELAVVAGPDRARDGRFPVRQVPHLRGGTHGADGSGVRLRPAPMLTSAPAWRNGRQDTCSVPMFAGSGVLTNGTRLTGDFSFRLLASDHEPKMKVSNDTKTRVLPISSPSRLKTGAPSPFARNAYHWIRYESFALRSLRSPLP